MTLTIELDFWFAACCIAGLSFLALSVLRALGIVRLGNPVWVGASPLATALAGFAVLLQPIADAIKDSGPGWLGVASLLLFCGLLVMSGVLESRARADLQPNQSLQQTLDPAADPASAGPASASSAAERRR